MHDNLGTFGHQVLRNLGDTILPFVREDDDTHGHNQPPLAIKPNSQSCCHPR